MRRNFTPDQTLIDKLLLDDTTAFEELFHRYCYPLYSYCNGKLDSPDDARRIVRDIFISLWENRYKLPVNFSISSHLYTEVRKAVVKCLDEKLTGNTDTCFIEKRIIPGFSINELQKAKQPVKRAFKEEFSDHPVFISKKRKSIEPVWSHYLSAIRLKNLKHALQSMLNIW